MSINSHISMSVYSHPHISIFIYSQVSLSVFKTGVRAFNRSREMSLDLYSWSQATDGQCLVSDVPGLASS